VKKIVLISAAMGGAALVAFGASGTFANFNATTTLGDQSAAAGTFDLTVDGGHVATASEALKLVPDHSTQFAYWVNNASDILGTLSADLVIKQDAENGCSGSEQQAGDNSCDGWTTGGEFSKSAMVRFLKNSAANADACKAQTTGTEIAPAVLLKTAADAPAVPVFDIAGGKGACVVVDVNLPKSVTNVVQSDSTTFNVDLTLTQK